MWWKILLPSPRGTHQSRIKAGDIKVRLSQGMFGVVDKVEEEGPAFVHASQDVHAVRSVVALELFEGVAKAEPRGKQVPDTSRRKAREWPPGREGHSLPNVEQGVTRGGCARLNRWASPDGNIRQIPESRKRASGKNRGCWRRVPWHSLSIPESLPLPPGESGRLTEPHGRQRRERGRTSAARAGPSGGSCPADHPRANGL